MISAWMLYGTGVSLLLGCSALALERTLRLYGRATRWAWAAAPVIFLLAIAAAILTPWNPALWSHADVTVTRAPDRAIKTTTTDAAGRYSVTFENGTGDYLVSVRAPEWKPVRKRITRTGTDAAVKLADGVPAALGPEQEGGDLAAIAASAPGSSLTGSCAPVAAGVRERDFPPIR